MRIVARLSWMRFAPHLAAPVLSTQITLQEKQHSGLVLVGTSQRNHWLTDSRLQCEFQVEMQNISFFAPSP